MSRGISDTEVMAYCKATGCQLEFAREVLMKMKPALRERVLRSARSRAGGGGFMRDGSFLVEDGPRARKLVYQAAAKANRVVTDQGLGRCHAVWEEQKRILWKDHKIRWYSPTEMNPFLCVD
jgi:hypothetical protein